MKAIKYLIYICMFIPSFALAQSVSTTSVTVTTSSTTIGTTTKYYLDIFDGTATRTVEAVRVTIPPGLRVEETANILAKNLGWTTTQKKNFIAYTNQNYNYLEGTYFPDTYLIPLGETPKKTYDRLIAKFNEKFAPYRIEFTAQNFPWLKALTLASLVQREAANTSDMPLIAGILLNRIGEKMKLGVDATVQYVRGDKNKNVKTATTTAYWAPISVSDKKLNSKYNTYLYTGLPPHPIDSPGLDALNAVLNPATTTCLYYLHDKNGVIHCSVTYEEHLQNIETYLKN